jgi:hypothetical protein
VTGSVTERRFQSAEYRPRSPAGQTRRRPARSDWWPPWTARPSGAAFGAGSRGLGRPSGPPGISTIRSLACTAAAGETASWAGGRDGELGRRARRRAGPAGETASWALSPVLGALPVRNGGLPLSLALPVGHGLAGSSDPAAEESTARRRLSPLPCLARGRRPRSQWGPASRGKGSRQRVRRGAVVQSCNAAGVDNAHQVQARQGALGRRPRDPA